MSGRVNRSLSASLAPGASRRLADDEQAENESPGEGDTLANLAYNPSGMGSASLITSHTAVAATQARTASGHGSPGLATALEVEEEDEGCSGGGGGPLDEAGEEEGGEDDQV